MAGTRKIAAVGLRDVQLAPRITAPGTPVWTDVLSVTDASYKQAVSEVEQYGDDVLQNTFYHSTKGTITVKTNYLQSSLLELVSGNPVTSSGAGAALVEKISIGTAAELTPPRVMVQGTVANARHDDGTTAVIRMYFYNCSVRTAFESIPDASTGKLMEMTLTMNTYISSTDELGAAIGTPAFGRLELN